MATVNLNASTRFNASRFMEKQLLDHFFRGQNIPSPQLFLALYISDPTDEDIVTEVQGGAYARRPVSFSEPVHVNDKTSIVNDLEVRFPTASADWGMISHWGIRTAAVGGELLVHAAVPVPKLIENQDEAKFNAGTITISAD